MNILVTGGAGFIGSNLIDELLKDDKNNVVAIDNFDGFYTRSIKEDNLSGLFKHPNFKFIELDIRSLEIARVLRDYNFDCIIHLAAKAGVRPSIERPAEYVEVNIMGTQNLLNYAVQANIPQFVFASSSSVYGVNTNFPWSESDTELEFISPYAYTKISGEQMGKMYTSLYPIRFIALRFFTVYGPRQRPDLAIHKFFKSILSGNPIEVYGDGSARRDFTYVDDIVSGIIAAVGYQESKYDIFNLGNNVPITVNELIENIEETTGKKAVINYRDVVKGDVPVTYADISKSGKKLNYKPAVTIPDGLQRFYKWYQSINKRAIS